MNCVLGMACLQTCFDKTNLFSRSLDQFFNISLNFYSYTCQISVGLLQHFFLCWFTSLWRYWLKFSCRFVLLFFYWLKFSCRFVLFFFKFSWSHVFWSNPLQLNVALELQPITEAIVKAFKRSPLLEPFSKRVTRLKAWNFIKKEFPWQVFYCEILKNT